MKNYLLILCSILTISCSKESIPPTPEITPNTVTLYAGDKVALSYNLGQCTWISDEPLIAKVDNNGCVTAKRVGMTTIRANTAVCKVTVEPTLYTYMEPCLNWGASKSNVKAFMWKYQEIKSDSPDVLLFKAHGNIDGYLYGFKNGISLEYSAVYASIFSWEKIVDFLLERYVPVTMDYDTYMFGFLSIDKKLAIATEPIDGTKDVVVVYGPFKPNQNSKSSTFKFNDEKHIYNEVNFNEDLLKGFIELSLR